MSIKKRKLNRGLDALLGTELAAGSASVETDIADNELKQLPIEFLQRGQYQNAFVQTMVPLQFLPCDKKYRGWPSLGCRKMMHTL